MGKITRKDFIVKTGKCVGGFVCIPAAVSIFQSCDDPVSPTSMYMAECPCHGAQFDENGNVLKGPAQIPLAQFDTSFDEEGISVTINNNVETILFSDHPTLSEINGVSSTEELLLYRKSENEVVALSRSCTHEGCTIGTF